MTTFAEAYANLRMLEKLEEVMFDDPDPDEAKEWGDKRVGRKVREDDEDNSID